MNDIRHCENCRHMASTLPNNKCDKCGVDKRYPSWEKTIDQKKQSIIGVAEEEMVENYNGGRQSKLDYRFDLIDTKAIFALANVLHTGEQEYGKDDWRKIDTEDHLNHALSHIYAYLAGDKQDNHLSHALCRCMMSIGVERGDV